MIYVTDNFSMQMFNKRDYNINSKTVKKSKFFSKTKDAISSLSSKRIARMLHKKVGKKEIILEEGDEIYVITSKFGRNKSDYKKENSYRFQVFSIN